MPNLSVLAKMPASPLALLLVCQDLESKSICTEMLLFYCGLKDRLTLRSSGHH